MTHTEKYIKAINYALSCTNGITASSLSDELKCSKRTAIRIITMIFDYWHLTPYLDIKFEWHNVDNSPVKYMVLFVTVKK